MKNQSIHLSHPVPRQRWTSAVCAVAVLVGVFLIATSAMAQGYPPYVPRIPTLLDTLYVGKGGNDQTGTGTFNNRFATINRAMQQIYYDDPATLILVGPGTYNESVHFPYSGTTWLKSEAGPDVTTIIGDGETTLQINPDASDFLLDGIQGFTIAGNNVSGGECYYCAGAIQAYPNGYGDQLFIIGNRFINNTAGDYSGAIWIQYPLEAFIIGNEFINNRISNNYFGAGAILYEGLYGVIANNVFARNRGLIAGGIFTWSNTHVKVSGNTFVGNMYGSSVGAGAIFVSDNIPQARGAGKVSGPQTDFGWFANNIVANNVGPAMDADYFVPDGPINCLFYGNGGDDFTGSFDPGINNLTAEDPLFADPDKDDYHITCGSPARDAGSNDYVPFDFLTLASDIDGPPEPRIGPNVIGRYHGTTQIVDIGADEFNDTHKIAEFSTPDTVGCAPLTVHFTNESVCIDEEYGWNFGDFPADFDSINAVHVYTEPGLYTVQLKSIGFFDTTQVTKTGYIRVLEPLTVDFSGDNLSGCGSLLTKFTATADAEVDSFQWVFGDGDSAYTDTDTTSHEYTTSGVFTLILRTFNPCGMTEVVKEDYITTLSDAEVSISSDFDPEAPPCAPADISFSYESDQELTDFMWLFGDGRFSEEANPTHTYENAGTFTVTFTATSDCGDVEVQEPNLITILGSPVIALSATPTSGCEGELLVQFNADIGGDADSSRWHFDDGFSAPGPEVLHSYTEAGEYHPFLVVYHQCGVDTADLEATIIASPIPVADFSASPTAAYETEVVEFTDLSQNATSYAWDFGDGGTSTEAEPGHEFAPGVHTVTLEITNACGTDAETKTDYIQVGSFAVTCDSTGTIGDTILYAVDVDSLVIGYDHSVGLSAQLLGSPTRGSVEFVFSPASGTPPFTSTLRAIPKGGLSSGSYAIRITADDVLRMAKTTQCSLKYTARQLISVPNSPFAFGEVIIGTTKTLPVVISNTATAGSGATLAIGSPSVTGTAFSVTGSGGTLQPGGSLTWQVRFAPTLVQPYTGTLRVGSDDPIAPSINISLTGSGIPVPDLTPPCVASTNPANGTEIAIDSVIRVTFSEGMVRKDGILIVNAASRILPISGTTVWETNRRLRFTPNQFLPPDDNLSIIVVATVTDSAGNTLDGDCNGTAEGTTADDFTFECTTGPGVFPGDTDDDGFVNEGDIIPLGRFWMMNGPPRTNPQSGFTIQPATAWNPRAATYADADGDGAVDSLDICPVIDYFGSAQPGGQARAAVQTWITEAKGWSGDVVSALLAALDICDGQGPGRAAVRQFLTELQTSNNDPVPSRYALDQNYPNPFNPTTIIAYTLKQDANVRIEVFDIQGHLVCVLEDKFQTAGRHNLVWDGLNDDGDPVASGVYFYRMTTPDFSFSRKMVLVR